MQKTALGRIFAACGVPNWEEMFPTMICGKCYLKSTCNKDRSCSALTIVGAMGAIAAVSPLGAKAFAADLEKSINAIYQRY